MDEQPTDLTPAEILQHHRDGTLGELLSDNAWQDREGKLVDLLVDLHAAGQINLFEIGVSPSVAALSSHRFFGVQHIFVEAIPRVDGPIEPMMALVAALVDQAGEDGVAYRPNGAFKKWCEADPSRAHQVVGLAEAGDARATRFLGFALEVLGDLALMRRLALEHAGERRAFGITALGLAAHPNAEERKESVSVLREIVDADGADEIVAAALAAALRLCGDDPATIRAVVAQALAKGGDQTLHAAARILWDDQKIVADELLKALLAALMETKPSNIGTIKILDYALHSLVKHGKGDLALGFLTEFLKRTELDIEHFNSAMHVLLEGPGGQRDEVIVRWLLSGNATLCLALTSDLRRNSLQGRPLSIDFSAFDLNAGQVFFISRKAIGFFFMQPVTAGSILVSAMRTAAEDLNARLEDLLFDPLLRNYGGDLRDYLEAIPESDPAHERVASALARHTAYIEGLKSVPTIKELHPSEHRRQIERFRSEDEMREAMKGARKHSVLMDLVKKSVVLYGLRTLSYMDDPGGERRAFEMELKSHGVTHEWPRMETVDPVRLDEMLKYFRVEQLRT